MFDHKLSSKILIILILFFLWAVAPATAAPPVEKQKQNSNDFIYTVQPGETLSQIALRYNLTLAQIILANDLPNPNLIFPGQQLLLPGISASNSPKVETTNSEAVRTHLVQPGETLSQIANNYELSIGSIILTNDLINPDMVQVGQLLQIPDGPLPAPKELPPPFVAVELSESIIIQGRTLIVRVTFSELQPKSLTGQFEGSLIFFTKSTGGYYWGLIPIHALAKPNIYPIILTATLSDNRMITTFTNVTITEGSYGLENIQLDRNRSELLDAELIRIEQEKLSQLWSRVSLPPRWEEPFWYPIQPNSLRITSYFGTRRTYNQNPTTTFHGGIDFGGGIGTPIYAPATGTVLLAEGLTIRGNTVLIDHGLGLFSGYWHLSQLAVTEGQEIQPGHLIGHMGDTGLATGPHLHWEIRLHGIAVDPLQWVQQTIP